MSAGGFRPTERPEAADTVLEVIGNLAKAVAWLSVAATVVGLGFLIYTAIIGSGQVPDVAQASRNIDLFGKLLLGGVIGLGISTTYIFWGEDVLGAGQLILAAVMFFSPLYMPATGIVAGDQPITAKALTTVQSGGMILGLIGIIVLLIDLSIRTKGRLTQGSKADMMKFGKGIKTDPDRQNVFMGKCWQLPFCRKFVREKCPIYFSKRTCWNELVGCMCEEAVIQNAMEGKPIPKEAILAANYIPRNHKLTVDQKKARCRQCVIYNEHQRHKYRLYLPITLAGFGLFYLIFRIPLLAVTGGIVDTIDRMIGAATFKKAGGQVVTETMGGRWFNELLLVCIMFVLLAYVLKVLEYTIFKLKL